MASTPSPAHVEIQHHPHVPSAAGKKIKTAGDEVREAMSDYLSRRRYSAGFSGTSTLAQMALRQVIHNHAAENDVVGFASAGDIDPKVVDAHYSKLKLWISESPDSFKPELAQLLYPLFTHLYLELVVSGKVQEAYKFHKKHHTTFVGNTEFAQFIFLLTSISRPEDVESNDVVRGFRKSKYVVSLSDATFGHLIKYLQDEGLHNDAMILVQVFRLKIDLRVSDAHGSCSKAESTQTLRRDAENSVVAGNVPVPNDDRLKSIIKAVRDQAGTPLPCICLYKIFGENTGPISARISRDSWHLATGNEDSSVDVWDLLPKSEEQPNSIEEDDESMSNGSSELPLGSQRRLREKPVKNRKMLRGHSGPVYDVAFMDEGMKYGRLCRDSSKRHLLSVSGDKTMRLWHLETGNNLSVYRGHSYPIWCVDVERMGLNVITGSMDKTVKLWQVEYNYPLRMYVGHESDVDALKFHPNCNYFATASNDKTVRLWSHADAKMVRVFTGPKSSTHSLAFSPDGKLLAAGGEDRRIRIWDIGSSSMVKELKGHSDIIYALAWHADSKMLASAGMDGTTKLWDVQKGSQDPPLQNGEIYHQNNSPTELINSYPTSCSGIIDLSYSVQNTLMAVGLANSSGGVSLPSKPATSNGGPLLQAALTSNIPQSNVVKIVMNGGAPTLF